MGNSFSELLGKKMPYVRVRYEDMAKNPREVIPALVDGIAPLRGKKVPFINDDTIFLGPIHTLSGNPDRLHSGPTQIRVDSCWRKRLPVLKKALVNIFSFPLLWHYKYFFSRKNGNG
jgi:hypothetical protein